jgi:hypothetical protein
VEHVAGVEDYQVALATYRAVAFSRRPCACELFTVLGTSAARSSEA